MRLPLSRNLCRRLPLPASPGLRRSCASATAPPPCRRTVSTYRRPVACTLVRRSQYPRTFFGLFKKQTRQLRAPQAEPGYPTLVRFRASEKDNTRPPPRDEALADLRAFLEHMQRHHRPLNSTQAFLVHRLLLHLLETESEDAEGLTDDELRTIQELLLAHPPSLSMESHVALCKTIYDTLTARREKRRAEDANSESGDVTNNDDLKNLIAGLTRYGASETAKSMVDALRAPDQTNKRDPVSDLRTMVLAGFAREGQTTELVTYCELNQYRDGLSVERRDIMTTYFTRKHDLAAVRYWFYLNTRPTDVIVGTPSALRQIANACFETSNATSNATLWVSEHVHKMMQSDMPKPFWDAILYWLVLCDGRGPDYVREIIARYSIELDAATINVLVEAAIAKKDPYLAERFISYGFESGFKPNVETMILQMNYRVDANDLSGAHAIFKQLAMGELKAQEDNDVPVINKYVRALCDAARPDIDRILHIVGYLEDRRSALAPETLAAFCTVLLKGDRQWDVIDLLSMHTQSYSLEQREKVYQALVAYCLNVDNSTARVWDSYSLLRQFFPETSQHLRRQLMHSFFERKRPDMAVHVFGHMRGHTDESMHPDAELYIACLEGLGFGSDEESVKLVHNMLKMDTRVPVDTKMYNALMIAYIGSEQYRKAMEFWRDITNLPEGPTYQSLEIVFKACEHLPFGDHQARAIWQRLERLDADVPPLVHAAYLGALASGGRLEEVKRAILGVNAAMSLESKLTTFANVFNALPPQKQQDFETWARQEYPEVWAHLAQKGQKMAQGRLQIKLSRRLQA